MTNTPDPKPARRPRAARIAAAALAASLVGLAGASAQRSISGNGFDSGTINVKPAEQTKVTQKTVKTIQYIAISPRRQWRSADEGKDPIVGELIAFGYEKGTGRVSIMEGGKIRMLVNQKKVYTFPLSKLSADDQMYVEKLVDSARIAGKLIEPAEADAQRGHGGEAGGAEHGAGPHAGGTEKQEPKPATPAGGKR